MEPKIQSSFIPKNPVTLENKPKKRGSSVGFLFMSSLFALIVAGVVWGGLIFYKSFIEDSLAEKSAQLERARNAFAPALIQEIERLDDRLTTAEQLTDTHLAPSILFDILEGRTVQTVEFTSLVYSVLPDGTITLSIEGVGNSFSSVALQSDLFEDENAFMNSVFSGLNLSDEGDVTFTFQTEVDPSAVLYSNLITSPEEVDDGSAGTSGGGGEGEGTTATSTDQSTFNNDTQTP